IGCAVDFVCRLLHLKIISLKKPLQIGLCNKAVSIYQNNQLIRSLQIENDVHIEEANIFQRIMMWFSSLFSIFSSSEHSAAKLYPIDSH
ncbi:hypothetical protein PXY43_16610, partial [Acinetobacter baumannii]|nr:hypothetical protein [Acinetobacter baumannii]